MGAAVVDPVVFAAEVAAELKGMARSRGVSQARLARLAGIPVPTLCRKLNGRSRLLVCDVVAIAGVLDADLVAVARSAEARAEAGRRR